MVAERREAPSEKSGAYSWFPRDFSADEHVVSMTLEQEGAYRRLLDYQWLNESIPADIGQLAAICKFIPRNRMERIWKAISPCFHPVTGREGRLQNRKLERVRAEALEYRRRQSESGRRGGQKSWESRKHRSSTAEPPPEQPYKARSNLAEAYGAEASIPSLRDGMDSAIPRDPLGRKSEPADSAPEGATPASRQRERVEAWKSGVRALGQPKAESDG